MESRGRQDLFTRQQPEVLSALREQAMIQSSESSNRIEGVTVSADRLRPILLGKSAPRDRSEEELVGYRRALNWIYTQKAAIEIEPRVIRLLHEMAQGSSGDAGKWKTRSNEIIEIQSGGERRVRFVPTAVKDTPRMIEQLCLSFTDLAQHDEVPVLLSISTFIFDFLCIHPFRDGNGRVSRLLTALLLQNHGFRVGRFISLERLVEETKQDYYDVLARCSARWHDGKNEIIPWWNYSLGVLRHAYNDFERRVEGASPAGKSELVRQAVQRHPAPFTLSEIQQECPGTSPQLIRKVLSKMKAEGTLRLTGHGRSARWQWVR